MQWIILIGDNLNLKSIRNIVHFGANKTADIDDKRFVVDYGVDHVFYDEVDNIINDYETEEFEKIPFQNPHFIMMTYTSKQRMIQILSQDNYLQGIYIDNDHGMIVPIDEFIKSPKTDY
ncbi:hypothetical protein H1230_12495 [Paenibacillus sp. 19GGS1-52]|uniref:hypothetical protein n=1 Tax=Paenibacillus sp. 19GGS1-52 TaxID=2758563 RepID=UPI001EFA97B2|nr:hypothetical protein [Paenibacillus sp. 19GGS1-52]ULO09515.1 hypothetical protein H1230_12495 [Paenibacillus sp. 19GGS1-52]